MTYVKTFVYKIQYRGRGPTRDEFVTDIAAKHNFRVLEETPEHLEVETGRGGLGWLRYSLPGWSIERVRATTEWVPEQIPKEVPKEPDLDDFWDFG